MSDGEHRDEAGDRLSRRFETTESGTDTPAESDTSDTPEYSDTSDTPAKTEDSENTDSKDTADTLDPKEIWTGRNLYIPDGTDDTPDLLTPFDGEYRRFQYECDWEIRKQTHYYPVLIQKGTDQLEEMSGEEFTAAVEDLGLR